MVRLTLAAALLCTMAAVTTTAQVTSTPLDPGIHDYLVRAGVPSVRLESPDRLHCGKVTLRSWSPIRMTISAPVAGLATLSREERGRFLRRVSEFNSEEGIGTLVIDGNQALVVHEVDPHYASPALIARIIHRLAEIAGREKNAIARR